MKRVHDGQKSGAETYKSLRRKLAQELDKVAGAGLAEEVAELVRVLRQETALGNPSGTDKAPLLRRMCHQLAELCKQGASRASGGRDWIAPCRCCRGMEGEGSGQHGPCTSWVAAVLREAQRPARI